MIRTINEWLGRLRADAGTTVGVEAAPERRRGRGPVSDDAKLPAHCAESALARVWPYSGFFDWHDPASPCGFLPPLLGKAVQVAYKRPFGLQGLTYVVNGKYILVGLNPSRDLSTLPINSGDPNCGNFVNFNLSSEYNSKDSSWIPCPSWRNVGSFVKLLPGTGVASGYLASYMLDFAPLVWSSRATEAVKDLDSNKHLRSRCERVLGLELESYKQLKGFVGPNRTCFLCIGADAFRELVRYARGPGSGLFAGARICRVRHYARNYHPKLFADLRAISANAKAACGNLGLGCFVWP